MLKFNVFGAICYPYCDLRNIFLGVLGDFGGKQ